MPSQPASAPAQARAAALARSCHPGPTCAVTALTALLAAAVGHGLGTGLVVTTAVFAGQLTIGWSNDLIDAARDWAVARTDKPIARGELSEALVRKAIGVAGVACALLSLACGWRSALTHLVLGVAAGWAYNLGVKRTAWSALPYAVAFGALPAVVSLALPERSLPQVWMVATGAVLGVGAHLLNALPDLADDAFTGVKGLPQRLGAARVRVLAPAVLLAGSVVATLGPGGAVPAAAWVGLASCAILAAVAVAGRGRRPFAAAIGIALVDVAVLVLR